LILRPLRGNLGKPSRARLAGADFDFFCFLAGRSPGNAPDAAKDSRTLIEQAMYFALGFFVAGLLTLMSLPALWRRAMRLSVHRLHMLAPMSMEQAAAERDLLRAESATRYRRLEQQMAAVRETKAKDLADIGRHAARIADLDAKLTAANARGDEFEKQLLETQKILAERTDLLSSTESALHEMTERAERSVASVRNLRSDKEELSRETELHRTRVVTHETKIASLHAEHAQLRQELDALQQNFMRVSAEAERLAAVDAVLADTTRQLDATIAEKVRLEKILEESRARLAELDQRRLREVENLESALRLARAEEKDHADRLEIARSDNAMLQGAVEALRKEHAVLREERHAAIPLRAAPSQPSARVDEEVVALREAIADIGSRMAELAASDSAVSRDVHDAAPSKRALQ
jgi:chromosome segregation ATPase